MIVWLVRKSPTLQYHKPACPAFPIVTSDLYTLRRQRTNPVGHTAEGFGIFGGSVLSVF